MAGYRRSIWKILGTAAGLYAAAALFLMLPPLGSPLADNLSLLFWLLPAALLVAWCLTDPFGSATTSAASMGSDGDGGGGGNGGGGNGDGGGGE